MKKRKVNTKKLVWLIGLLVFLISFIYSSINVVLWVMDNMKTQDIQETVIKNNLEEKTEENLTLLDKYSLNFEKLKSINEDIVGYLIVENAGVNSLVVKHSDNSYYLKHSLDKSVNRAGWIFADYKNKYDGTDKNLVIYGHNRKDGSMFGTLKNILKEDWYKKSNNILYITEDTKYLFEAFSVYKVKAEDYYTTIDFDDNGEFKDFIDNVKKRSVYDFKVNVDTDDMILTLSTCYSDNRYRVVLHAKAVEIK